MRLLPSLTRRLESSSSPLAGCSSLQRRHINAQLKFRQSIPGRALKQTAEWLQQTDASTEALRISRQVERLELQKREASKRDFSQFREGGAEKRVRYQAEKTLREDSEREGEQIAALRDALKPSYRGELHCLDLGLFGKIEVVHGDIFDFSSDALLCPMVPNFMPYRGFSLEVLEKGGQTLLKEAFRVAKSKFSGDGKGGGMGGKGLPLGTLIPTAATGSLHPKAQVVFFSIMPYFWQGSSTDSARRFRFVLKSAFQEISQIPQVSSLALPQLGQGVYGYEMSYAPTSILEEALEALIQIEASEAPSYTLRKISIVESRLDRAEKLADALTELGDRWIRERQSVAAPIYHAEQERRLIGMHENVELARMRKPDRWKFKRYHGIIRNNKENYQSNVRDNIWRRHIVNLPPALMVNRKTGEAGPDRHQRAPNPYYRHGITHMLFPKGKSTFHMLRRSKRGALGGMDVKKMTISDGARSRVDNME